VRGRTAGKSAVHHRQLGPPSGLFDSERHIAGPGQVIGQNTDAAWQGEGCSGGKFQGLKRRAGEGY
jgi:hypothetical protein